MNCLYLSMDSPNQWHSLPETLDMAEYECALFEVSGRVSPLPKQSLFICADFIQSSIVGENTIPVLRRVQFTRNGPDGKAGTLRKIFNKMLWLRVSRSPVSEVRLYITDEHGDVPAFESCSLSCTLVCIPHKRL